MSKFQKQVEKNAKNVEEAIALGLNELGVTKDEVTVEIIEEGSKGFLGIGAKDAKVRLILKDTSTTIAKTFLGDIFNAMNLEVDIKTTPSNEVLDILLEGNDMGIVIGKRGDTLDALQYLTSLIVNHESDGYIKVNIDTENYRQKRADALLALSNRLADKVSKSGKKFTLEPMNPYERRIIHANLQDNALVSTYSIGDDPYRKVVIAPKGSKSSYKKPSYNRDSKSSKTEI